MDTDTRTEETLVQTVLAGNSTTFEVLVHRYLRAVYAVAFAHCNHHADAEDISQEAFLKAYINLDSLRDAARFEGWVTTIARNLARKRGQRKHKTFEIRDDATAVNVSDSSALSQSTTNEIHQLIRHNIESLDAHSREVLHLHYFAGKKTQEIADLLETSQSAILKRLQRGRERLGERLLAQYKDTFAPEQSDKVRSDMIVKSMVAVTPTWLMNSNATTFASTTAATGTSTLLKLAAAAGIGSTFFIAASLFLMQQEAPTIAQTARQSDSPPEAATLSRANDETTVEYADDAQVLSGAASNIEASDIIDDEPSALNSVQEEKQPKPDPSRVPISDVSFKDTHIAEILQSVTRKNDIPFEFQLDLRAIGMQRYGKSEDAPKLEVPPTGIRPLPYVTDGWLDRIEFNDVTLLEALDSMAGSLGLAVVSEPGFVWISTPELIAEEVHPQPQSRFDVYQNEEILSSSVNLTYQNIHLSDVLAIIYDNYKINIGWDYHVVQPEEIPQRTVLPPGVTTYGKIGYINLRGIQLSDTLNVMLRPLGLAYTVDERIIWISTPGKTLQEKPPRIDSSTSEKRVLKSLEQPVGIVFQDIHIVRLLEVLTDNYELDIVLDQQITTHPDYTPETYGFYYAEPEALCDSCSPKTTGMIRAIDLNWCPLRDLLVIICKQLNLAYRVQGDTITLSNSDYINQEQIPDEFLISPDAFATQIADAHPNEPVLKVPDVRDPSEFRLLRIVLDDLDSYGVVIFNETQNALLSLGETFGDHTLMSVDVENNCCTLFNEPEGKTIQLCVEPE